MDHFFFFFWGGGGGGGGGVQNLNLKFQKKIFFWGGGGGGFKKIYLGSKWIFYFVCVCGRGGVIAKTELVFYFIFNLGGGGGGGGGGGMGGHFCEL